MTVYSERDRMAKRKKAKKSTKKTEPKSTMIVDPEVTRLREENARLKANAKKPQGIKNAKESVVIGEQPRAEEKMRGHQRSASGKQRKDMTEAEVISVERKIREYVKKGGSRRDNYSGKLEPIEPAFRKGLTADQIAYAKLLLKRMGRDPEKPSWDESIQVPGFSEALKGTKAENL